MPFALFDLLGLMKIIRDEYRYNDWIVCHLSAGAREARRNRPFPGFSLLNRGYYLGVNCLLTHLAYHQKRKFVVVALQMRQAVQNATRLIINNLSADKTLSIVSRKYVSFSGSLLNYRYT